MVEKKPNKFCARRESRNTYRLMYFFSYKNLAISNVVFSHKIALKLTCYSNDCKTANLVDYLYI